MHSASKHYFFAPRYIYENIKKPTLTGSLAILLSALALQASAETGNEEVYRLGEILVSERYLDPEIGSSYQITRDDFDRTGARSLEEALKEIPSLHVRNGADGTPRIDIRGLRTRQIKLLVNGIPFNSADDGQFDPTLIPTFAIGRIQVQAGASSVLYGDGGLSGVIDLQTRGAFDGFKSGGQAEFGSDHFWQTNAYMGYGDGTNDFFAAVGVRARDAFPMSNDFNSSIPSSRDNYQNDDDRNNSDSRRSNIFTSYSRQLTEKLRVGVFLSHVEGHYGKPPSVLDCWKKDDKGSAACFTNGDEFAAGTSYERVEQQRGTTVQLVTDYDFNTNWHGRLALFSNTLKENTVNYNDNSYATLSGNGAFDENSRMQVSGFHSQLDGVLEPTGTKIGLSLNSRKEAYDVDGYEINSKNEKNPLYVNRDIRVSSYAVELRQPVNQTLELLAGVGYHRLDKDGGSNESEYSGQIGFSQQLTSVTSLYGTLARKAGAPSIRQLYEPKKGSNLNGNPDLKFERADHLEFGLKNQWDRAALDVAIYQSRVHDFIEKQKTNVGNQSVNNDLYVFQGIDVNGVYEATDALTLRGSLGLIRARDESDNAPTERLQYRPTHKINLGAEYRFLGNWLLSGQYQRVAGQAYFNKDDAADYRYLDSFELVSARLRYLLPKQMGTIYLGADNLLDEEYETSYGFPQPGRFVYVGTQLNW